MGRGGEQLLNQGPLRRKRVAQHRPRQDPLFAAGIVAEQGVMHPSSVRSL
jgi:hypothetical protein